MQLVTDNCGSFYFSVSIGAGNSYGSRNFTVIASDDSGNTTSCSGTVNIVPPTVPTGYCSSFGNSGYEFIRSMKISTPSGTALDLVSGDNSGSAYFPAFPVDFVEGETIDFAYRPGFNGSVYAEYWRFYLDLNRDGDFDDAGELIMFDKQNRDEIRYRSITLPASFSTYGPTRMRVVMAWGGYRGACETNFWGEREDYLINLTPNYTGARLSGIDNTSKSASVDVSDNKSYNVDHPVIDPKQLPERKETGTAVKVWPNPATSGTLLNLDLSGSAKVNTVTIRQALGQIVAEVEIAPGRELRTIMLPASLIPGIYLLSGSDADREVLWTKRIVVR